MNSDIFFTYKEAASGNVVVSVNVDGKELACPVFYR